MRAIVLVTVLSAIAPATAHAFCGFYAGGAGAEMFNHATQVVLMRDGTTTVVSMQNNYQGPPERFALVVPVPAVIREAQVKTLPPDVFARIDALGAPRLVEYWEQDPCADVGHRRTNSLSKDAAVRHRRLLSGPSRIPAPVTVEASYAVGEYDIVVLSATESTALARWLADNGYAIPRGVEPLLAPYIAAGMKFFVARVDPSKLHFEHGMATLSPLRFYYDSPELALPIRLGLASSRGTQDLIVNILAASDTRYEVANHPNITIPTNLALQIGARSRFGEVYAALFDRAVERVPGAVVTEYAWSARTCDPCPGPALDPTDLATLGGDVFGLTDVAARDAGFTLTRLHFRYGTDVSADLVFRAVPPIEGGRGPPDADGRMSQAVESGEVNNFQARYAILHPWLGPIECAAPARGVWGAGPTSKDPAVATNLAFAPRGRIDLDELVVGPIVQLGHLDSGSVRSPRVMQGCGCDGGAGGGIAVAIVVLLRRRRATRA